jgi:hypothetical protein
MVYVENIIYPFLLLVNFDLTTPFTFGRIALLPYLPVGALTVDLVLLEKVGGLILSSQTLFHRQANYLFLQPPARYPVVEAQPGKRLRMIQAPVCAAL